MPFSCDYQVSTTTQRVRARGPSKTKLESAADRQTSQKSSVGFGHQSFCNRFIVRSDTGGSAQDRGVATLHLLESPIGFA
jgi:hypothetical protein